MFSGRKFTSKQEVIDYLNNKPSERSVRNICNSKFMTVSVLKLIQDKFDDLPVFQKFLTYIVQSKHARRSVLNHIFTTIRITTQVWEALLFKPDFCSDHIALIVNNKFAVCDLCARLQPPRYVYSRYRDEYLSYVLYSRFLKISQPERVQFMTSVLIKYILNTKQVPPVLKTMMIDDCKEWLNHIIEMLLIAPTNTIISVIKIIKILHEQFSKCGVNFSRLMTKFSLYEQDVDKNYDDIDEYEIINKFTTQVREGSNSDVVDDTLQYIFRPE